MLISKGTVDQEAMTNSEACHLLKTKVEARKTHRLHIPWLQRAIE